MGILAFLKSVFGVSGVADTALKIVEKVSGTDWTAEAKANFILEYKKATAHESPARRLIAVGIVGFWILLIFTWLVCTLVGHFVYADSLNAALASAKELEDFMKDNVTEPVNWIIGFYFMIPGLTQLGKKN